MKHSKQQKLSKNILLTTSRHEMQSPNSVREYSDPPIPEDLLVEIFSRVPLKSIARFRCVSKYLASIFRRPDFTELFLTKSLTRPRLFFTVKFKTISSKEKKLFLYSSPQPHNPDHYSSLVVTPDHTSFPAYIPCGICTTVYGLVLLQGWDRKAQVIYNPATGELLTLPEVLPKENNLPKLNPTSNSWVSEMYLGYDPIGKQFKVLCMTSSHDERPNTHQVLTLESGKRVWRTVEHKFHFVRNYKIRGEICIDGVLYFGALFGLSSSIVCFNLRSEKISFINMNENMELGYPSLTLFNYKGKLGILRHVGEELVLWVVEDAESHKWSKHNFKLSPYHNLILGHNRIVGMTSTGEVVLTADHRRVKRFYVSFYNLERKTLRRVKIQGLEGFKNPRIIHTFIDYVENLTFLHSVC